MCYFNSLIVTEKTKLEIKGIEKPIGAISLPVVSGFEYRNWPIISGVSTNNQLEDWKIEMAEWGHVPYYVSNRVQLNTERIKLSTLNARNDNLLNSNIWKNAAHAGRCLILSSGFFEYRHIPKVGKKGQLLKATEKYPYFVTVPAETEHSLFVMAGIKSWWTDRNTGETIDSFAIVTTEANGLMERIHNTKKRMPTILTKSLAEAWLNPNLSDNEIREIADYQFNENEMIAWTVAIMRNAISGKFSSFNVNHCFILKYSRIFQNNRDFSRKNSRMIFYKMNVAIESIQTQCKRCYVERGIDKTHSRSY